MINNFDSI